MATDGMDAGQVLPAWSADWAVFLDVDGTLLDLAERPSSVRVEPDLPATLERLRERHGGALALVSGRTIADIDALFEPLRLAVAGAHGVERRDGSGRVHRLAVAEHGLRAAATRAAALAARHAGLVFEDKGFGIALHYRMAPALEAEVERLFRDLAAELGDAFELQSGKMVWELKPRGRDKGTAIAQFMAEAPFSGRTPLFVGDDLTDESGFAVVNRLGGYSVKVGQGESQARYRLPSPACVRGWLADAARSA